MSPYEAQARLPEFEGVLPEYARLVIHLGYVVLFAPAFPLASLVCYAAFALEIRQDAYKLLAQTRRPRYEGAQDIGPWFRILVSLGVVGVFTNIGLVGLTSSYLSSALPFTLPLLGVEIDRGNKAAFLFACEHLVLAAQYVVFQMMPDEPPGLPATRARLNWRRRATVELAKREYSSSRPIVIDGSERVLPAPVEWDDHAIPDRFWREPPEGAYVEPRQGREWAKLVKAGEYKAGVAEAGAQPALSGNRVPEYKPPSPSQPKGMGSKRGGPPLPGVAAQRAVERAAADKAAAAEKAAADKAAAEKAAVEKAATERAAAAEQRVAAERALREQGRIGYGFGPV